MFLTRRQFLPLLGGAAAAQARTTFDATALEKFVDPLPMLPVAAPVGRRPHPTRPNVTIPFFRIAMREVLTQVHRDAPQCTVWSYGPTWPGSTIEARSGEPIAVQWANQLPKQHMFAIDHTLHGAEASKPDVRTVVHLHGGRVSPGNDGYPESWYTPGNSRVSFYPNQQEAAQLFYHDHAMGITRLNTYAGLIGLYTIRDAFEDALDLPRGPYEIPLILCDRSFTRAGQLAYPVSPDPRSPWVPEVFGESILTNGKLTPFLNVEPRMYRFRCANGSNGRFYRLALSNRAPFFQIGTDQGLLSAPVSIRRANLAPGERADLVIDFSKHAGENVVLTNDAFELLQFRVAGSKGVVSKPLPAKLRPVTPLAESSATKTRLLTLAEETNMVAEPMRMLLNGTHWDMPVTEDPHLNSTEIWSLVNFTDDSHPIHLHLVRFQILDRRAFEPFTYQTTGQFKYLSAVQPPDAAEAGWKDTVRAAPKSVTRIIVKFEGFTGRYVWHCHIAEHEDNEMMRPYDILPEAG